MQKKMLFGAGALVSVVWLLWCVLATDTEVFTFPTDTGLNVTYRCETLGSAEATLANAKAANLSFLSVLAELAQMQATEMQAIMQPARESAAIIPELEQAVADGKGRLDAAMQELQESFGCKYLGSAKS
ncbi:MAG: hypothetical protein A2092_08425 [Rhodobacteraceae bacterium GWE1_64_9]|nr:MAG: hypothetical protein A2092_08425 [Rhodobacteraceae bacterium GWE1_64_9]HBU15056.1 hypothetical protein [Gemmobacter sp.]